MVKPEQVSTDHITPSQIGRAHKCYDCRTRTNYYLVENSRDLRDEDGNIIEYKVTYSSDRGFQCECYAGKEGFVHCKLGICQHCVISVAAAREEREAMAAIAVAQAQEILKQTAQPILIINGESADQQTLDRVMNAKPAKKSMARGYYQPKAFSII